MLRSVNMQCGVTGYDSFIGDKIWTLKLSTKLLIILVVIQFVMLLHDDVTELVDIRDLTLLHCPFDDAPQMLSRVLGLGICLASSALLPWVTSAKQRLSGKCVWGCYYIGILLGIPSFQWEGILLCFSTTGHVVIRARWCGPKKFLSYIIIHNIYIAQGGGHAQGMFKSILF